MVFVFIEFSRAHKTAQQDRRLHCLIRIMTGSRSMCTFLTAFPLCCRTKTVHKQWAKGILIDYDVIANEIPNALKLPCCKSRSHFILLYLPQQSHIHNASDFNATPNQMQCEMRFPF